MRTITFHVQSNSNPNYVLTTDASILRPPVVLVHGLWGRPSDWSPFVPLVNDSRFFVRKVDYSSPLVQGVTATNPIYLFLDLTNVHASALGFTYNYPLVDTTIRRFIFDFRHSNNAAAVRADVVAHSMGGDIVRTLALEPGYANDATYGLGPINKLITIGTPHLGTPLAIDLLDDADDCVRRMLALNHKISFTTVTTTGGVLNGAVGDLQTGSLALQFFDGMPPPFAMAMVSATENGNNLSGLNCTLSDLNCNAAQLRALCGQLLRDPVGLALTYAGWPGIFSEQASDAVVPLTSQVNGRSNPPLAPIDGIVHSAGMEELNFNGPQELDYPLIPATVINLLNESPSGPDFQ